MPISATVLATGVLSFTAALAWNEAIKDVVHAAVPPSSRRSQVGGALLYASIITLIVVIVAIIWNTGHRTLYRRRANGGSNGGGNGGSNGGGVWHTDGVITLRGEPVRHGVDLPARASIARFTGTAVEDELPSQNIVRLWSPPAGKRGAVAAA